MTVSDPEYMDLSVEEFYRELDVALQDINHMNITRWKLVQNTVVSILVALLAVEAGADPTIAIGVIALINGLSLAELATILSGVGVTVESEPSDDTDAERDDSRS